MLNIALCSYVLSFGHVVIVLAFHGHIPLHFLDDIDIDEIATILEHHFCMFGNFMPLNVMVMKEVDNNFVHFQKQHQTLVGLEWRVEASMYRVWGSKVFNVSQSFDITLDRVNFIIQDHDAKLRSWNRVSRFLRCSYF